jgi:ABC-2 type transport system ATP-binding protein
VLRLDDIARSWGERPVLDGATLVLAPGRIAWLGGVNGAGKTTLLRIACGLLGPHRGTVTLDGLDPARDREAFQRRLGFLSAGNSGLYARLTVVQHLRMWADLAFVPRAERSETIDRAVKSMALGELADRRVDRLSMGQRQRVRVAMTFLHRPDVILLDEPHTSLDEGGLELLSASMDAHVERGGALLWCSPSLALGELRHDDTYVLDGGKVVERT